MGDIARRPSSGSKIRLKKGGQARLNFFTIWLAWPPGAEQQELPLSLPVAQVDSTIANMMYCIQSDLIVVWPCHNLN